MAKEINKNEPENIEAASAEVAATNEIENDSLEKRGYVDPFALQREQDESGVEREGASVTFKGEEKDIYLSKYKTPGNEYNNYAIGFELDSFGVKAQMRINMEPIIGGKDIHRVLDGMFGEEKFLPLDIVKTVSTINGRKNVTYSPQITKLNEKGVPVTIAFRTRIWSNNTAATRSERELFNIFIDNLKAEGAIT